MSDAVVMASRKTTESPNRFAAVCFSALISSVREVISQRQVIVGLLAIAVGLVFAGFGALPG